MDHKFINPKVKDFMKDYENMTIIGLYWAMLWRFYILVMAIAFALGIVSVIFS